MPIGKYTRKPDTRLFRCRTCGFESNRVGISAHVGHKNHDHNVLLVTNKVYVKPVKRVITITEVQD